MALRGADGLEVRIPVESRLLRGLAFALPLSLGLWGLLLYASFRLVS